MKTRILLLVLITVATLARAQDPTPAALAAAGDASRLKLQSTPAAWTLNTAPAPGVKFVVDVLHTPTARRLIYRVVEARGATTELARVVETPGAWYVTEGAVRRKHRPYEADFQFPLVSLLHEFATPRFVTAADAAQLGRPVARDGDLARYAVPPNNAPALRNVLKEFEAFDKANPGRAEPATRENMAAIKRLLDAGVPVTVDVRTGLFTQSSGAKLSPTIADFRWLDPAAVPAAELKVDGRTWDDFTADPTAGGAARLDNLAMLGHAGFWRPGTKGGDTDAVLLDLATGRARRVPYQGPASIPGCFVKNRAAVVVCGVDLDRGGVHLCEVDLKTGANRPLGGAALAAGNTLMPALSPDGKTLAAHYKDATGPILESRVALIDLATGDAKLIGKPFDGAFVNWLPDGSGLIVLKREHPAGDPKAPETKTVCRMTLDTGELTPLFKGDAPLVLAGGKSILFEQEVGGERQWMTRALDGSDPKALAPGLGRVHFPANSPDGQRLLMMSFTPGQAPRPLTLDLATGQTHPIPVGPGLWATPAWR